MLRLTLEAIKIPSSTKIRHCINATRINPIRAYPLITVSYLTIRTTANLEIYDHNSYTAFLRDSTLRIGASY